jgi:hypothetical protein
MVDAGVSEGRGWGSDAGGVAVRGGEVPESAVFGRPQDFLLSKPVVLTVYMNLTAKIVDISGCELRHIYVNYQAM